MRKHWPRIVGLAVVCGAIALAQSPSAAGASTPRAVPLTTPTSTTIAGYDMTVATSATLKATFTVPTLSCTSTFTAVGPIVVIEDADGNGTGGFVLGECSGGTASYAAYIAAGSNSASATKLTPSAGNKVTVTATETATASSTRIQDVTTGQAQSIKGGGAALTQAVVGAANLYDDGVPVPVATFGTIKLTGVSVNSQTVRAAGGVAYNLKSGTDVQVRTGALDKAGNAWTETFVAAT